MIKTIDEALGYLLRDPQSVEAEAGRVLANELKRLRDLVQYREDEIVTILDGARAEAQRLRTELEAARSMQRELGDLCKAFVEAVEAH